MAGAGQRLGRRFKRGWVGAVDDIDLSAVKHRHSPEEQAPLLLVAIVASGSGFDGDGREDPDRLLALADLIAELLPGTEPADIGVPNDLVRCGRMFGCGGVSRGHDR